MTKKKMTREKQTKTKNPSFTTINRTNIPNAEEKVSSPPIVIAATIATATATATSRGDGMIATGNKVSSKYYSVSMY